MDELKRFAELGFRFHAPGAVVAEALFVLCRKHREGLLSTEQHEESVHDLAST